jgi:hypothetical protein
LLVRLPAVLLLCLLSDLASAVTYKVELLVFQHLDSRTDTELWRAAPAADYGGAVDLNGARDRRFRATGVVLSALRSRLDNSRQYRVLEHVAWTQPGLGSGSAVPVRIRSPGALDGTVKVTLSRYLHVYSDFMFEGAGVGQPVRVRDHRRMRSRELHYIDHPLFGILVQITPV